MRSECVQRVIVNESDVPAGYIPLKSFGSRSNGESGSPEYELIHAAYRQRRINAVKHMRTPTDHSGLVFVDARQADELIRKSGLRPAAAREAQSSPESCGIDRRQLEAAVIALCEINNGISLMHATLERLTAAVEAMATQPKAETVGTWRDMNGESL